MQEKERLQRNSNIEFLRILAMGGVIILHFNNANIGGGFKNIGSNVQKLYFLYVLESVCICAVDVFILISGYFMSVSFKRDIKKPLLLLLQVSIFGVIVYMFKILIGITYFSWKGFGNAVIPANYFVILYCTLYMISPYINITVSKLTHTELKRMLLVLFSLFSVWPTLVDVLCELTKKEIVGLSSVSAYGSQWGYSLVNFILLYIIGAYLRKYSSSISKKWVYKSFCICIAILVFWARGNDCVGYFAERSAWEYCNPFVICEAVCIFLIFEKRKPKYSKCINFTASGVFSVFLLHSVLIVPEVITKIVNGNIIEIIIGYLLYCICIYSLCILAHWIYNVVTTPIYSKVFGHIKTFNFDLHI